MAAPNTNYSEILTTTIENRSKTVADNVLENNPLLYTLKKKGKVRPFRGGHKILQELQYAENASVTHYSGLDPLSTVSSEVLSAAEYAIRQISIAIVISGLEEIQNRGREQMIDLLEARVDNAEKTMENTLNADCFSDGTSYGGKQINGLEALVADAPSTGTVGNINRGTYSWWQNIVFDCSSTGGAAMSAANVQSYLNQLYVQLVRNTDMPNLYLADNNYYRFYWESLQAIQRVGSPKMADAGFATLEYMGQPFVLAGGVGGAITANHIYALNCNYLYLRPASDRDVVPLNPDRFATNQDAMVRLLVWAGNMTMSNAKLQGVIIA